MGALVVLVAVKLGTFPEPLAASPMLVLELVQEYAAPAGVLLKLDDAMVAPAQLLILAGANMTGKG